MVSFVQLLLLSNQSRQSRHPFQKESSRNTKLLPHVQLCGSLCTCSGAIMYRVLRIGRHPPLVYKRKELLAVSVESRYGIYWRQNEIRTVHGDCTVIAAAVGRRLPDVSHGQRLDSSAAAVRRRILRGAPGHGIENGVDFSGPPLAFWS